MLAGWVPPLLLLAYAAAFFGVARLGDAIAAGAARPRLRKAIYALSSAVTFGFWSSYGAVGTAARHGGDFLPLFIGPILIYALFHPVIARMIRIARAQKITSLADFVAGRYGRSVPVAATVTLISLFACLPFIAVQIEAIAHMLMLLAGGTEAASREEILLVALVVAGLAVVVGTRRVEATENQSGLMTALAGEALLRVVCLVGVGAFVSWGLFNGIGDLTGRVARDPRIGAIVDAPPSLALWLPLILVAMGATLVMPRQFHVAVVENRDESDVRTAAWLVPACLVAASIFVLPVAVAGLVAFPKESFDRDFAMLTLPLRAGHAYAAPMALVALGVGFSASIGTIVVGAVALAVMACNDLVVPLLLWSGQRRGKGRIVAPPILAIRRVAILAILAVPALVALRLGEATISKVGLSSIVCIVQIAPAAIGALIWSGGTARGAIGGMLCGVAVAAYTQFLPALLPSASPVVILGPLGLDALRPTDLFGVDLAPLQQGVVWSLAVNVVVFVALSLSRQPTAAERLQANVFVRAKTMAQAASFRLRHANVSVGELLQTVARFVGEPTAERLFREQHVAQKLPFDRSQAAEPHLLQYAERLVATTIGSASARMVISLLLEQKEVSRDAARQIVDDAAFEIQNSRDLLQHAIDIARDGMAVFDAELRLIAWNRAYREMFRFPQGQLRVGVPLETLIRSNAERGIYGPQAEAETFVAARLDVLAQPTRGLRMLNAPAGRVLEMRSVRLHNGGLFFTYTDATAQAQSEEELEAENETLERRVRERTEELERVNVELVRAKAEAEDAYITKSRFLAAASHDVLQPLSAARLYASSLRERLRQHVRADEALALAANVDLSLEAVEEVMSALLEISQLDAGATKKEISGFALQGLFHELRIDFAPQAIERGLKLTFVPTTLHVESDRRLLRRLLQNLVSNALKYTPRGRVLVGVRRRGAKARIDVLDSGLGIPDNKLQLIFREFERLPSGQQAAPGAGLGLSIVERLSRVLEHEIAVRSTLRRGSMFSVLLPLGHGEPAGPAPAATLPLRQGPLDGLVVVAIDNELPILAGMEALLHGWGCLVACGVDLAAVEAALASRHLVPDAIVADYHIGPVDDGQVDGSHLDGLGVIAALRKRYGACPAVLVTADRGGRVRELAQRADVRVLHKPLKPATLRALLSQWRLVKTAAE